MINYYIICQYFDRIDSKNRRNNYKLLKLKQILDFFMCFANMIVISDQSQEM